MNDRAQANGPILPIMIILAVIIGISVFHEVVQQSQMTYNLGFVAVIIALFVGVIYKLWIVGDGDSNDF